MILERFEVPGLAHYSYLLASEGRALVIDPKRDIDAYMRYAFEKNLLITHVLESHIHADYVSGATALSEATGAQLWLSGHDQGQDYQYSFDHHAFIDGDELVVGDLRIAAMHTPGHTPEHLSFLVFEQSRCGQPLALFSGDFIFVGSLGRPDLLGEVAKQSLARSLYRSVHEKIAKLPDGVEIHPAHGAGSLCGSGMSQRPQSTLGYERFCNIFLSDYAEDRFIESILSSVPEFPDYYRRMKEVNSRGPAVFPQLPGDQPLDAAQFRRQLEQTDALVIDLRRPEAFGGAHIPRAFNVGAGPNLSMWAAWVVPYGRPILLVGGPETNMDEARRALFRVGFDQVGGYLRGGMPAWIESGFEQAHRPQISVRELDDRLRLDAQVEVVDVRSPKEWTEGHIKTARHIPGGELPKRFNEVPREADVHLICGSGYRSSVASSVLEREGFALITNVVGGMAAWNNQRLPTVRDSGSAAAGSRK